MSNVTEAIAGSTETTAMTVEQIATAAILDPNLGGERKVAAVVEVLRAGVQLLNASMAGDITRGAIPAGTHVSASRAVATAQHAIRVLNAVHGPQVGPA